MSRWTALPVFAVLLLLGSVSPTPWVAVGLALLLTLGLLLPRRATTTKLVEILLSTFLLVLGTVVLTTLLPRGRADMTVLRGGWAAFASATLLVAVARFYLQRPLGGDGVTLAIVLVALTSCGGALTGPVYPLAVVGCLAAAFFARSRADEGCAPRQGWRARLGRGLALVTLAGVLAWGAVGALPPMHEWAMRQIWMRAVPTSGFSDRLYLGSMRGMLLSDDKVMRIHGEGVDYLRGVVFRDYEAGRWSVEDEGMTTYEPASERLAGPEVVEIEVLDDEPRRYFFPLGAADIRVASGIARHDRHGIVAPIAAEPADRLWYRPGDHAIPVAPPGDHDRAIGQDVRPYMMEMLRRWDLREGDPRERLERVLSRLQHDYEYALSYDRGHYHDPTVDFLLAGKKGHCEYFASAFALMARTLGFAARVVGGYRVFERNPLGDHWIVRERNAHAWVEVWLDGAWTIWDPTPPGELVSTMQSQTPTMDALLDLGGTAWAAFLSWLDRRTWTEMGTGVALALLAPILYRWLRRRRRRDGEDELIDPPLACFDELTDLLTTYGIDRRQSETIEQQARRVEEAALPEDLRRAAASLLRRYAALRYGQVGTRDELDRAVGELAAQWSR